VTADFFQPGHSYTHRYGYDFLCVAITTHPITGERLAMGWHSEHGAWHRAITVGINQWNHEYDGADPSAGPEATQPAPDYRAAVTEALRLLESAPEAFQATPSQNITAAAGVLRRAHALGGGE
jgi:hypothetical protein